MLVSKKAVSKDERWVAEKDASMVDSMAVSKGKMRVAEKVVLLVDKLAETTVASTGEKRVVK